MKATTKQALEFVAIMVAMFTGVGLVMLVSDWFAIISLVAIIVGLYKFRM